MASVRVVSILPEGEPQGTFDIQITPTMTGQDLLRRLCRDANVPLNPEYILQTDDGNVVGPDTLLTVLNVQDGKTLRWDMTDRPHTAGGCWNSYWFMAVLSVLIGAAGMVAILFIYLRTSDNTQYGIVFDAGSSHTSMFVYKWDGDKVNKTAVAAQDGPKCNTVGGGISSFANNASEAGESLVKCLEKAKSQIPSDKYKDTPVYLGATAGMRLLEKEDKNASDAVMAAVRAAIARYPFTFTKPEKQARILTGLEEGSFSWITSNYITGAFHEHPPSDGISQDLIVSSVGALDMGGASTQISFVPNATVSVPYDFRFNMSLYGTNYSLYTHSFLCYGVNEATKRYQAALLKAANFSVNVSNPCSPKGKILNISRDEIFSSACVSGSDAEELFGFSIEPPQDLTEDTFFFNGESNATECEAVLSAALFNFTETSPYPGNSCSFNGVYQPPVFGDFYAFSSFFYLMEFLNLTTGALINYTDFTAASQDLCAKTWDEVKTMKTDVKPNLPWYCFQSLYINTLLVEGYKFDPNSTWRSIHFVESISGTDAGWTLGFIINESNQLKGEASSSDLTTVTFALLAVLFCAFILMAVYFAYHARRHRRSATRRLYGKSYGAI
ncbi:hypothetical protein BaRGS_00000251 [Batillaria attramentaria]|uniref:Uncharacterized protein n=1 Tax=Batillaria attramentaria TaxID=370345 RepID=A0ABD0M9V7_9CAEN